MHKVKEIQVTIDTKTSGSSFIPDIAVNGCRLALKPIAGGTGTGETFIGKAEIGNLVHSIVLHAPSENNWEIAEVEICAQMETGPAEVQKFGPFTLGGNLQELKVWDPPKQEDQDRLQVAMELLTPWTARFLANKVVHDGWSAYFGSREQAQGSPLPEKLFTVENLLEVIVSRYAVTISVIPGVDWNDLVNPVAGIIQDHILAGGRAVKADFHQDMPSEKEFAEQVNALLEMDVNPYIASHGGFVKLLDVKENNIYLQMGGGCQGCASAGATLKFGVERVIRNLIPKIGEILDHTDHSCGVNPYYPRM